MTLSVIGVQNSGSQLHGGFYGNHGPRPENTKASLGSRRGGGVQMRYITSCLTCRRRPRLSRTPPRLNLQEIDGKRGNHQRGAQMGPISTPPLNLIWLTCAPISFSGINSIKRACLFMANPPVCASCEDLRIPVPWQHFYWTPFPSGPWCRNGS